MSRLIRMTVSAVLLASVAVEPASARSSRQQAEDSWDNLKALHAGQKIEVVDFELHSLQGKFRSVSSMEILLEVGGDKRRRLMVPREKVFRVITKKSISRVKNSLIGLGVGAGVGLLIAGARAEDGADTPIAVLAVTAGLGALTGAFIADEVTVYHAPAPLSSLTFRNAVNLPSQPQDDSAGPQDGAARRYPTQTDPLPDNGETAKSKSFCCSIPLHPGHLPPHDGPLVH